MVPKIYKLHGLIFPVIMVDVFAVGRCHYTYVLTFQVNITHELSQLNSVEQSSS
jgi:hypothetical protein